MISKMQKKVKDLKKTAEKSSKEISKACEKKPFFKKIKNFLNSNDPVIFEFRRKIFHLVGGIIPPIFALIFPTRFLMWIVFPFAIAFIILDWNDLETRVLKDFTNYGDRDWKMSLFFTHYNENNGICLNSIMNNYSTYISDGKTRNDILIK